MTARFVTFSRQGKFSYGLHTGGGVVDLGKDNPQWPSLREVIAAGALEKLAAEGEGRKADYSLEDVTLEIPVPTAGKIICVGVNFPDRNEEYKDGQKAPERPSLFIRFPGSFVGEGSNLVRPPESEKLDYEGEITIVIGKGGRRIPKENAYDHIAGLTLCNEGTIRDWVRHAKFNVTQGKNWDRSGSMGPWLIPFTNAAQLDDVKLQTRVNGEVRQEDRTSRMLYDFRYIVNYVSTFCTLEPGDTIVCGTPTGAGARFDPPIWLKPGDIVEVEAEGIGTLTNGIEDEKC